jgi:SAM-dependent methyltransferase
VPTAERYTHGYAEAVLASHSKRTVENSFAYGRHLLRPGLRVLDLGCGPGTISVDLAARVAPGQVVGVDIDASVLARAGDNAVGVSNLSFLQASAYQLGFSRGAFDLSHAHQVLQHLGDPVAALRELARVTRRGGTVAVRDADYGALSWYPELPELEQWRTLYRAVARANGGEPDAGRHLLAWAHGAGLDQVEVHTSTWTFSAGDGASWWGQSWAHRVKDAAFVSQAASLGLASAADIAHLSEAWLAWADHPDAVFVVPHTELLITC